MKILHITPSLLADQGGLPASVVGLSDALLGAGMESSIATTRPSAFHIPMRGVTAANSPLLLEPQSPTAVFSTHFPNRLAASFPLLAHLLQHVSAFDVVHIHQLFLFPQFSGWISSALNHKPYIVSLHGAFDPYLRKKGRTRKKITDFVWQRRMINGAFSVHTTAQDEYTEFLSLGYKADGCCIPLGVDLGCFLDASPDESFRSRVMLDPSAPLVMCHGRIAKKKGFDILLRAVSAIPRAHLVLVGPDRDGVGAELLRLAAELKMSSRFRLVPPLAGAELAGAISAADVWALPSHGENFGLAIFEAMACGKAVVTSPFVNTATAAAASEALIIAENEPNAVAAEIGVLLASPSFASDLGTRARFYATHAQWPMVVDMYIDLYQRAIESTS